MINFLLAYILGLFCSSYFLAMWFESTIFLHIISAFLGEKIWSFKELIDLVEERSGYLADLLSCGWCLGFYVSVLCSSFICFFLGLDSVQEGILFILACSFSWPFISAKFFGLGK